MAVGELVAAADDPASVNDAAERYVECVVAACERAVPRIAPARVRACRWWTLELSALKAEMVRRRRRIAKANPLRRRFVVDSYLEARVEFGRAIEGALTASWKAFCTGEEAETIWRRSYRIMRACRGAAPDRLLCAADGSALDAAQSAALLAEAFFPRDALSDNTPEQTEMRARADAWARELRAAPLPVEERVAFTEEELDAVLKTMSPKRAPGGDGLTLDICLQAWRVDRTLLLDLYTLCLSLGCFPLIWKVATIKVIPKPNKESYTSPKSYRLIGLLPVLGKVLEKLFVNRLQWQLGSEGRLSPFQYGFTPQRSSEDALNDALSVVRGGLSERRVYLGYAGETVARCTDKGCVQGSTCGPILWNLLLEPVLEQEQYGGVRVQAFADDILMVAVGADGAEVEARLNRALGVVVGWGQRLKLEFAPCLPGRLVEVRESPFSFPHPADRKRFEFGLLESQADVDGLAVEGPIFFTDGSKLEGKVGAAVSCWSGGREVRHATIRLESFCTVFQAELSAISKAQDSSFW